MQAVKTVVDSGKLDDIIRLPSCLRHKKVEVIVRPVPGENKTVAQDNIFESESFGMWKDRQDMDDVESYVRNLQKYSANRRGNIGKCD